MKIGLLGGSFDPVHDGHIKIAKTARKELDLDEVWLIPVLNNPFKDRSMASGSDRIAMIELACRKEKHLKVCDIELHFDPTVKSYTYHTLIALKQKYPSDSFYYIIGADQALQFDKWYHASEISELVQLVCFARPGFSINEQNIKTYHMLLVESKPVNVSSSAIRSGNLKHVDKKVIEYFTMQGLYLEEIAASRMSEKRFIHTKCMAELAVEIAKANHLDEKKAYVAGMLHDIAKEMDNKKAEKIMKKHFSEFYDMPRPVWHQWLSYYVAKKEFHVHDQEILQAIIHHTTASLDMSPLDMCIYVADKFDRSRGFDSSAQIAVCKENLLEGFKLSLTDFYTFSKKKNRPIDPIFFEIYKKYVEDNPL